MLPLELLELVLVEVELVLLVALVELEELPVAELVELDAPVELVELTPEVEELVLDPPPGASVPSFNAKIALQLESIAPAANKPNHLRLTMHPPPRTPLATDPRARWRARPSSPAW